MANRVAASGGQQKSRRRPPDNMNYDARVPGPSRRWGWGEEEWETDPSDESGESPGGHQPFPDLPVARWLLENRTFRPGGSAPYGLPDPWELPSLNASPLEGRPSSWEEREPGLGRGPGESLWDLWQRHLQDMQDVGPPTEGITGGDQGLFSYHPNLDPRTWIDQAAPNPAGGASSVGGLWGLLPQLLPAFL